MGNGLSQRFARGEHLFYYSSNINDQANPLVAQLGGS
jgi:hypothetical protein